MKKKVDFDEKKQTEFIKEDIKDLKRAVGYQRTLVGMGHGLMKPDVSISEKIDHICNHLGIEIVKTKPQVIIIKPPKA